MSTEDFYCETIQGAPDDYVTWQGPLRNTVVNGNSCMVMSELRKKIQMMAE